MRSKSLTIKGAIRGLQAGVNSWGTRTALGTGSILAVFRCPRFPRLRAVFRWPRFPRLRAVEELTKAYREFSEHLEELHFGRKNIEEAKRNPFRGRGKDFCTKTKPLMPNARLSPEVANARGGYGIVTKLWVTARTMLHKLKKGQCQGARGSKWTTKGPISWACLRRSRPTSKRPGSRSQNWRRGEGYARY